MALGRNRLHFEEEGVGKKKTEGRVILNIITKGHVNF